MSKITELASSTINGTDSITIELVEADETPTVVILRWPLKPTRVPSAALPRHRSPDRTAVCGGSDSVGQHQSETATVTADENSPGGFPPGLCRSLASRQYQRIEP